MTATTYETLEENRELAYKCAAILACVAHGRSESTLELEVLGVRQNGIEIGDWRIVIECINYPGFDC